jgi:hypothetical protein
VSQDYDNPLALPIRFRVLSTLLLVTSGVDAAQVVPARVFAASRHVHSYIHTTYNKERHRLRVLMRGVVALLAMWILYALGILQFRVSHAPAMPPVWRRVSWTGVRGIPPVP